MREEEYQSDRTIPTSWLGGWESVNGNPDVYIFCGYDGSHYLLTYSYDKEYGRGSFFCYEIDFDEEGCCIRMGTKCYRLSEEQSPCGLRIGDWGSYIQD